MEHANIIWHQIQSAKKENRDLHVIFLDLANAFGSVPHKILWMAFSYFRVPDHITDLVKSYFHDLQFCITVENTTTAWQQLEIGIMAGCTISPLAFVMAMQVVIRASRWVVGGERTKSGLRLPPVRAYMDDMTLITTTKPCTRRLLQKLQENIQWARMQFKPSKSRSISIVKGQLTGEQFYISEEPIPTVFEKPIKSLGRWYSADLKDTQQIEQLRRDLANGLKQMNNTGLPGKLKLWCYQFGLLPRLLWPLTILVEDFKCAKVRLDMSLTDSRDPVVRGAALSLATGKKWTPATAVLQAKSALLHCDVVGHVQQGRGGFGLGALTPLWQKASATERRTMVVQEVRRQEESGTASQAGPLDELGGG
ncbi:hypothetical protein H4Q32_017833 [Labeo rohita]|uniref:Reverse transcriptase domain-containing protein n=1 Tax=Labeo rohita TaxID=84645 RepID=A0ABQ8LXR7_LABRO|nr:hypothetical protein H4Q32_017833 [Labeo rohita]